ncbi:hypothetical protein LCGC14_2945740 [marine sediment metagenome]|uniref:Uncharacterized protein n=1 Tax=marine sediment metagenome TaxID=412755 RepID=A0A0F8ZPE2_9ZZZZ
MDAIKQHARELILLEMYASMDRQTQHILNNNEDGMISEVHLQQNQRGRFELFVEDSE